MKIAFGEKTKLILVVASVFTGILLVVTSLLVHIVVDPIPPGAAHAARVLLSLGAGLAGAGLIGSLKFEGPVAGVMFTAGGGGALFLVVYFFEAGIIGALY